MSDEERRAPDVFLVGPRYRQHATYSGYEGFRRHVGTYLVSPVQERWPYRPGLAGRAERLLERLTKPAYTFSILRIELAAARHALGRRGAVYHVLYGDTDAWLLGRLAPLHGNAVVASFHEGEAVLRDLGIDERVTRHLSAAILLAEAQRPYFERIMPAERVFVVPHGVETGFFTPAVSPDLRSGELSCITVGGHTRDFETLARAIEIVRVADPRVRFLAVSTHVGHKGAPFASAGVEYRSGLTDEELLAAYRASTLAVFSFEWAIANNALLEAMACGLPIVATAVGGVPEYVSPDAGILCRPRDPEGMAQAMLALLGDPVKSATMGVAARHQAETCDYRVVAGRLADVYLQSLRFTADRALRRDAGRG